VKFYLNLKVDSLFSKWIILNKKNSSLYYLFDFQNLKIGTGKSNFEFWKNIYESEIWYFEFGKFIIKVRSIETVRKIINHKTTRL